MLTDEKRRTAIRAAGLSDVGRCRQANQDQFFVGQDFDVVAIADGMGGHAAGEVASDIAIAALAESMGRDGENRSNWSSTEAAERLRIAMNDGNRKICEAVVTRAEWRGMGTTMVALVVIDGRAVVGHVGDSRAYLLRDGRLRQLTSDHSWVNEQVKLGLLTDEEARRHPMRNIVTRALGNQPRVEADVVEEKILPGDVFALCSDGLNGMILDSEIEGTLAAHGQVPRAACQSLVEQANANGGEDNITVIVMAVPPVKKA
ncbi:Stp1/IreP family PP2C-type Ser/Thr phosphatase [bacterium]|nr:MAG: Stp1/IreP family PP2C-type Ser/Thr phosphatase [bacterium]